MGSLSIEQIWLSEYPGLFRRGVDAGRPSELGVKPEAQAALMVPCLHDASKVQLSAVRETVLDDQVKKLGIADDQAQLLRTLFAEGAMDVGEIRTVMTKEAPQLNELLSAWDASSMKSFNLSSVGMAIGHANIKRFTGEFAPLRIWIN